MISFTSSRVSSRIVSATLAAAIAACVGVAFAQAAPSTTTAPASTQAATQPSEPILPNPVVATINGEPIARDGFDAVNTQMHGVDVLRLLESVILADKACKDAGIPVTEAQDKAEKDRMLQGMAAMGLNTKEQQEAALSQLMISRGVSQVEFSLTLHRAACLRALAKGKISTSDADIQSAFDAQFGKRVRFRDVLVKSVIDGAEIIRLVEKEGRHILEVVNERNLPMNSYDWNEKLEVPEKQVKDTAFQLKEHELSHVITVEGTGQDGKPVSSYHILYLEKQMPADTTKKLDDAMKADLRIKVTEQKEAQWGQQHMDELIKGAHVEIKDPYLQVAFQELMNRQRFMQAASTRPAGAPPATSTAPAPILSAPPVTTAPAILK